MVKYYKNTVDGTIYKFIEDDIDIYIYNRGKCEWMPYLLSFYPLFLTEVSESDIFLEIM